MHMDSQWIHNEFIWICMDSSGSVLAVLVYNEFTMDSYMESE